MTRRSDLNGKDRPVELLDSAPQVEGHLLQAVLAVEELNDLISLSPSAWMTVPSMVIPWSFPRASEGAIFT
jgi:hypothetical protein